MKKDILHRPGWANYSLIKEQKQGTEADNRELEEVSPSDVDFRKFIDRENKQEDTYVAAKSWLELAKKRGISPIVIKFVMNNPAKYLFKKPVSSDDPHPSVERVEKVSNMLKGVRKVTEVAYLIDRVAALCGVEWANAFADFLVDEVLNFKRQ